MPARADQPSLLLSILTPHKDCYSHPLVLQKFGNIIEMVSPEGSPSSSVPHSNSPISGHGYITVYCGQRGTSTLKWTDTTWCGGWADQWLVLTATNLTPPHQRPWHARSLASNPISSAGQDRDQSLAGQNWGDGLLLLPGELLEQ
ncbi:LOW QUALITY PROTEIN: hypothetical protein PoB_000631700 [Plakobranchus ocellatus]|uniref:Uncharacterized protein n=1 Tax=Plakobranchus ocellatus TaxID=259542 RepID=A0AAV3YBK7_9GAST|nr:LOW QUALITY PROTEIN: hypothetical protein PoB_000631700 [Plakobranchus ocellatus]